MVSLIDFFASFLGAGVGAALLGFLARDWIAVRIKAAIDKEALIQKSAFELKRSACLEALDVVDAAFSQLDWRHTTLVVKVAKQPLEIAAARRAYNQLALTCVDPNIVELYATTLGLRTPEDSPVETSADQIVDLRNAMRKELGFGAALEFDRRKAWIANLDGAI